MMLLAVCCPIVATVVWALVTVVHAT